MVTPTILIVDDRADIIVSAQFVLEDNGYQAIGAKSPYDAKDIIEQNNISIILLDMNYSLDTTSGEEGLEFLAWLQKSEYNIAVVAMTAWSNVELAVKAMQLGAGDFIEKPWKNQRLLQVISQQLELSGLKQQNKKLAQRLEPSEQFGFQWQSSCMTDLLQQIESVAAADVSILLTGENGTGKSQLAQHIHQYSSRSTEPFISVNMGAISESLFESEMFGHNKGAFTDAKTDRIGRFELANKGTIFLDEIANIPLSQQAKLLRVLETGEYEVLGSSKTLRTNVRIISATNGDVNAMIGKDEFREDLLYRLNTIEFRLPPLRARQQDIIPLAEYFLEQYRVKYNREVSTISAHAKQALMTYHWPGNIRELSHLTERAVLLAKHSELVVSDFNLKSQDAATSINMMTLEQAERLLLKQALSNTDGNMTHAAKLLGLTKSSMYRRLEKYDDIQK